MSTEPVIAIVGAPNAGKSTLFNRLLGRRKALVHRQPGMTRDVNDVACDWEGRPVRLVDTGGLFAPDDSSLEREVRQAVLAVAEQASVLIFVVDGRTGLTALDEDLARLFRETGRPLLLAVNKLDMPGREEPVVEFHALGFDAMLPISAEHGLGIDELRSRISALLPEPGPEEAPARAGEIRVALAGRPNVGKSSLLNKLLGRQRALVSEVPGTTRDSIDCLLERHGRVYRIIDTAGIRRKGRVHALPETLSVMSARRNIESADVVLLLMDVQEAPALQDLHVAGIAKESGRPFIVLLNKWDLVQDRDSGGREVLEKVRSRLRFAPFAPILTMSALTGDRVGKVLPLVGEVHEQASRRFTTGRLNAWLQDCVKAHHPPAVRGKAFNFYYMTQNGTNPPSFVLFTSSPSPPHFSYQRYLENSLRSHLGLTLTPVVLVYRQKPRRERRSGAPRKRPQKRSV